MPEGEVPQMVGRVTLKVGRWKGDPRKFKEKIRVATARAFQKTRLETMMWMQQKVPFDTGTLLTSGIQTLMKGSERLYFPFEMWFGFPAETEWTYKTGERKGETTRFKYAKFVDEMTDRGASPRKPGAIAPFMDPGKYFLIKKLKASLKAELGDEFPMVDIEIYE